MPTPKNKYDREHLRRIEAIKRQIDAIYAEAVKEAAALGVTIDMPQDAEKPFSFDDYPMTEKRIEELMAWLRGQLETAVVNGIKAEWALSNDKNDAMVARVFGSGFGDLPENVRSRYLSTNDAAREAFIQRKRNGLGLSDYVWKYADGFKDEIEMGLDLGIREGKDAPAMARDLKQYLRHPDMLFRRVRDEHGMLHLSRRAAAFHPGRGVYRSSYLNARRLAATETNIAYRTADHERWKQMDFVVGIEIHLSNNHTCKGRDGKPHPFDDICDELQGKYPKDFKFTGWHPHCRCFATSILKTDEEIAEDTKKILRGEPVTGASENRVEDVPEGFKKWTEKNEGRISEAKSLPYFVRENGGYAGVKGESVAPILATPASVGQQRSTDIHDLKDTSPPPRSADIHNQRDTMSPEFRARIDLSKQRREEYRRYKEDPNYYDVEFSQETLGLKATHIGHNFDKKGGEYERHVQTAGYKAGHAVILENERGGGFNERFTEGTWDGMKFEVAGRETATSNNILRGLKHCASKRETEVAILDFPKGGFNEKTLLNAIDRYRGLEPLNDGQYLKFKKIICVQNKDIVYEMDF